MALSLVVLATASCGGSQGGRDLLGPGERMPTGMSLTSPAFRPGRPIPERFSCEGENVPPPLRWTRAPGGTGELALVVEDPDAPRGTFVHWLVVGMDPATTAVEPEPVPPSGTVLAGSSDNAAYVGPCPPDGSGRHRYFSWGVCCPVSLGRLDNA